MQSGERRALITVGLRKTQVEETVSQQADLQRKQEL